MDDGSARINSDSFSTPEDIEIYNPTSDGPYADKPTFQPGDHVYMWCEAAGGVRYQHHGIVLHANNSTLKIADFTAPDSGTFALPDSIASASQSNHRLPQWHGVRVTTYTNIAEWHVEAYAEGDDNTLVLQRVKFLLSNPHLVPEYELTESNCETVAVWCKTGCFRTHQIAGLVDGGKRNSVTVGASSLLASSLLGPIAIPAMVGAAVTYSALSFKESRNENLWRERTEVLNEEFRRWMERQRGCVVC
jgi:hypothetical protein